MSFGPLTFTGWRQAAAFAPLVAWVAADVWALRPGRCQVCGTRTRLAAPRDGTYSHRAWWDLRPPTRRGLAWVCPDHWVTYLAERIP